MINKTTSNASGGKISNRFRKTSSGKTEPIFDEPLSGGKILRRQDPKHMAPEESPLNGRVNVVRLIGKAMVMTMMGGPPQRPPLRAGSADERSDKLPEAGRLVRAMREIAMVDTGDRQHAHPIQHHCRADGHRTPTNPEDQQTRQMQRHERYNTQPVDVLRTLLVKLIRSRFFIEPTPDRHEHVIPTKLLPHTFHPVPDKMQNIVVLHTASPSSDKFTPKLGLLASQRRIYNVHKGKTDHEEGSARMGVIGSGQG